MDNGEPDRPAAPDAAESGETEARNLIVVGIGASAGGLEAFTDLVSHLPPATGMAFILVQHLDPHHESALPGLLAGRTSLPVLQVHNDTRIEPDHIYVIPPNSLMLIRDRSLILEARPAPSESFKPIDAFFNSLAREFHFNAVGVVLSGTATDGTLGLKSIKAEGGVTFAQNQTAKFDSMPRSAVAAGAVDFVLSPRRIAEELTALAHRTVHLREAETDVAGDGTTLHRLLLLLRRNTGVDFAQYKQPTVLRRLNRRMVVRKAESLEEYFELLQKESGEVQALFDDLLINVTDFFRDPEVYESAKRIAFPSLIRDSRPRAIRAWIPGCSSGEEVYSMAIALMEFLESEDLEYTLQMFGTDLSDGAIAKARAGIYGESSVVNVSPERLRRFFARTESGYQISRAIREMCVFSRHNVAKDPPLSRMDLISCRNLLIYLAPSLQQKIVATFAYALQPNGCLILGSSETLGSLAEHFLTLDEPHRIYGRKANLSPDLFHLSEAPKEYKLRDPALTPVPRGVEELNAGGYVHKYVDRIVLSRYGPAALVVNEALQVVEYRGDMRPYLAGPENQPDADLMSMVRPELHAPLSAAIEQARRTNLAVVAEGVLWSGSDGPQAAVTVVPLALSGIGQHFLILFGRVREKEGLPEFPAAARAETEGAAAPRRESAQLEQELKTTREYLQSVIEELRSTNEEAQSANEELQSTNEELQTSKEELQSANEELNTINAEMQSRNTDLARLNDDLMNLFSSLNMPIMMTGNDLRIRRFTPTAEKVLRLIAADVGRPIADLKPRINVSNLEEILQRVVDTLQPHEQEVQDQEGRQYLMRVRPYRTGDNRIDGTVLQLSDVSDLKRSLEEVKHARDYAESIVNTVREPLVVLDQNLAIQNANRAFYDALGLAQGAAAGQTIYEAARGRFNLPEVRRLFEQLDGGAEELNDVEIGYQRDGGEPRILSLNARRLQAPGQKRLILMAFEDITERKRAAEARYRRVFESARDGIVLANAATGEITDVNPFTEQLLGYPRDELVGRKLWEIEPMRNLPGMRAAFEQVRDRGVLRFNALTLRTKEGRDIHAEAIANVYSEGDRPAVQLNVRDVSERKKFERELQETQKLESLGLLAGGIAHDFNNLLTGILGNASLAYSELPEDDPLRIHLREILQAGERAAFLTRQMLAYAGKGRFVTETIDLGNLIREISALIRTSIPKSVELKLDLAPDLPPIEADPAQIQQVVMNLVINGAEAIGEHATGKVEVRTSLRELNAREAAEFFGPEPSAPGAYVQVEVTDTGAGMDGATQARIFDPFFTTKFTGRGLGLAAVQGIIKGHHGAIRVHSTPGLGTSFLILLPARRRRAAAVPKGRRMAYIAPGSVVLAIDDEEAIRALAVSVLSRAGVKVLTAVDGKAGVEMFREHHGIISAVLLDFLMPVMGGEEVIALLDEIDPNVPVILSSGFDESEAARRFPGAKPARFLQKPYTTGRLLEAVAAALKHGKPAGGKAESHG
jgi:two-component system CheB/CheR fusion protein